MLGYIVAFLIVAAIGYGAYVAYKRRLTGGSSNGRTGNGRGGSSK